MSLNNASVITLVPNPKGKNPYGLEGRFITLRDDEGNQLGLQVLNGNGALYVTDRFRPRQHVSLSVFEQGTSIAAQMNAVILEFSGKPIGDHEIGDKIVIPRRRNALVKKRSA